MGKETTMMVDRAYIDAQILSLQATLIAYFDNQFRALYDLITKTQIQSPTQEAVDEQPTEEFAWKLEMRKQVDGLVKQYPARFSDFNTLLKKVYRKMRNVYGIVPEQDIKEYMSRTRADKRPSTLEIISYNPQYRSIFESVLVNIAEEARMGAEKEKAVDDATMAMSRAEIIQPLIEARGDKSLYGCNTHVSVRARMKKLGADFDAAEKDYRKRKGIKRKINNSELIDNDQNLKRKFIEAVVELLDDEKKKGCGNGGAA